MTEKSNDYSHRVIFRKRYFMNPVLAVHISDYSAIYPRIKNDSQP